MIVLTVTDASWAGEVHIVKGILEPLRSQRARFNGLAGPGFIEGNKSGVRIRAAIADARGMLGAGKKPPTNWEDKSAMSMRHLWMTDCRSLEEHLIAPTLGNTADKRLRIDLGNLRQMFGLMEWKK
eukprot:9473126-Pyramimonas_sp.AAC.1